MTTVENFEKLQGFNEVNPLELKEGDHIRYTKKGFQTETRKCVYAVIKCINGSCLFVESYTPKPAHRAAAPLRGGEDSNKKPAQRAAVPHGVTKPFSWTVDFNNKKKGFRFYKKPAEKAAVALCASEAELDKPEHTYFFCLLYNNEYDGASSDTTRN